jgi:hypothetical protein
VVSRVADGIAGAWVVGNARVDTGADALAVDATDLGVQAVRVALTTNWNTFNLWVSCKSWGTEAHRFMVGHIALRIPSTAAWVHTITVKASLSLWALIIRLATNQHRLGFGARYPWVTQVTWRACAHGLVVLDAAIGVGCARI